MTNQMRDTITTWPYRQAEFGKQVRAAGMPHLHTVLLHAYRAVDPSMTELPDELYQIEKRKFDAICVGRFDAPYFEEQEKIARNIASQVNFAAYLKAYGTYAGEMVKAIVANAPDATDDTRSHLADLACSWVHSAFEDAAVAMNEFFEHAKAEDEAAQKALSHALRALAAQDLRHRIDNDVPEKIAQARDDYNAAMTALSRTVGGIEATVQDLSVKIDELEGGASQLASRSRDQATALQDVTTIVADFSQVLTETDHGAPKFISKTDKQLILLRLRSQKCDNKGAVRLVLAGSGHRRDQVAPGWFCSGRGSCAFQRGRYVSGCAPATTGRCADWRFGLWPSAACA
jgi:methyl-accepting chemotaxis protein